MNSGEILVCNGVGTVRWVAPCGRDHLHWWHPLGQKPQGPK